MSRKTAFITGASRGIGAESAAALAKEGWDIAITARTLSDGEAHSYAMGEAPLPGSLEATAAAVRAHGGEALCLRADILEPDTVAAAADRALAHFGHIDLLFNNAVYQGPGNQEPLLRVTTEQLQAIYQGNVFTPLLLIQRLLPSMIAAGNGGTIINMTSYTAFNDPPAPADQGGWGFAYPSSKAALGRMAGSLRIEHQEAGLRVFNLEPGTVFTEVMRASGIDEEVMKRFKACSPQSIATVVAWLAANQPKPEWDPAGILRGPAIAKELGFLKAESLLENT